MIRTVESFNEEQLRQFRYAWNIDRVGITLKFLEAITKGLTDGEVSERTTSGILYRTRVWTTLEAATDWKSMIENHPNPPGIELVTD